MRGLAAAAVMAVLFVSIVSVPASGGESPESMLVDYGNGSTVWIPMIGDGTCMEVAESSLSGAGIEHSVSGQGFMSVGGVSNTSVGDQECSWRIYSWDGEGWMSASSDDSCDSAIALGFYPSERIVPVETPAEPTAWTMVRGDSASTGDSDSSGTDSPATPIEWYRTYTTGFVDSSIIVAGQYLYHTTGGQFMGSGTNKMPWVYCLDRYTGEEVWNFMLPLGTGYEVSSPLVFGDMLVVTCTNGDIYLFDRFTGAVYDRLVLETDMPTDSEGDILWDGRTFFTGATTPVYDSGALYFGTSDGKVEAYSVVTDGEGDSRTSRFVHLWEYDPESAVVDGEYVGPKGCFYYHAPVIVDVEGTKVLFIGNYEGYLFALDASTGSEIWVKRMIDVSDSNTQEPGTPGSVASVSYLGEGRIVVVCTNGAMSPEYGTLTCIDALTGSGPDGSDSYWSYSVTSSAATVSGDGVYCFLTPVPNYIAVQRLPTADGGGIDVVQGLYKFDRDGRVVWFTPQSQTVKATLTVADGRIYMADYSSGNFYPNGGGLSAFSTEDGSQVWKIRLEPFSSSSYNMCAPTVVDGRIYVGNDYGAVYCVSEVRGAAWNDSGEINIDSPGFRHWSWVVLAIATLAILLAFYRYYRGGR